MHNCHLRDARRQSHNLGVTVAITRLLVVYILRKSHTVCAGRDSTPTLIEDGKGNELAIDRRVAFENSDAGLKKCAAHAHVIESDGSKFFDWTGNRTATAFN